MKKHKGFYFKKKKKKEKDVSPCPKPFAKSKNYSKEEFSKARFSVSKKFGDFKTLIGLTDIYQEAKEMCGSESSGFKVYCQEGIKLYPVPKVTADPGCYYYVNIPGVRPFKYQELHDAIANCPVNGVILDQNFDRVY